MPEGLAAVPISGGTGYNVGAIRLTQWVVDPITGVGAWVDVNTQLLVMADKRGDLVSNEDLLGDVLSELRGIREMFEQLMLKLA